MSDYRCYLIDDKGHIGAADELRDSTDDLARDWAAQVLREQMRFSKIELWKGARRVACLVRKGNGIAADA